MSIVKYKAEAKKFNAGYRVDLSLVMKELPTFIKYMKEFFHKVKTRGKDGGRACTRCLILHELPIEELTEMLKEEMSNIRLFIKPQAVMLALAETTGWFIKLHPEINLKAI